jgi:carboxypeptidase C (cathepsin A)
MAEAAENKQENPASKMTEETPVQRQHKLDIGPQELDYTSTAGRLPIKDDSDEIKAQMFFSAYTLNGTQDIGERPLTFVFNGGPGSSSVWLHLGTVGPMRVQMQDEGWMPAPPYKLLPNEHTWLDQTDLVFIDPIGTGYSRADTADNAKKYWNLEADFSSIAEFIRLYLTRYERWSSPLYLSGESYGTMRAAGLSEALLRLGIGLKGIILLSTVLNMQTLRDLRGNDLPHALFLPTLSATAWYHGRLPQELQAKPLADVLQEVEAWIEATYIGVLHKGDRVQGSERQQVLTALARYSGLAESYIDDCNLRIESTRFRKELLREQGRTVGRLDSRFKGYDALDVTEYPDFDPSLSGISPPFSAMFYDYARRELGYETDLPYEVLSFKVNMGWEWQRGSYPDTSEALRGAMAQNPFMRVLVMQGYYDLATPYYAAQYTFNHMDIHPDLRENVQWSYYDAGHMFYIQTTSLAKLKGDVAAFIAT